MSESGLDPSIPIQGYTIPVYSPPLAKHEPLNRYSYMLGAYIKDVFSCGRDPQNEDLDFSFMSFRVTFVHRMFLVFLVVYRFQNDGIAMFDITAEIFIPSSLIHT